MDIALEDIIRHVPDDKHLVFSPGRPYAYNDIALLFRNSPEVNGSHLFLILVLFRVVK